MGMFDKLKKKNHIEKRQENEEINAMGWDAITKVFDERYPNQKNPKHYGTLIDWRFGGNDPLKGISMYDGGDYWHFVTYGLSELYEKESEHIEISGFGMELTFKLKKDIYKDEEMEIKGICGILQSIARITFTTGVLFHCFEYLYTGQTQGMDTKMESNITGFITVPEQFISSISTPNGTVDFVAFIGATDAELKAIQSKQLSVEELYKKLGSDITSYRRSSIV